MLCQSMISDICERIDVAKEDSAPLRRFDVNVGRLEVSKATPAWDSTIKVIKCVSNDIDQALAT